jgi:tetratricopeptide (TPR) repeat protein
LGLHGGPEIGMAAAASLAGIPLAEARALLTELTSAHLLADRSRGRFTFHDLLRVYARELAEAADSAEYRRAAVHRVLDHYLWTAYRANELLAPSRDDAITIASARPLVEPEALIDHRKALAWLTTEYPVLLAALRQAASQGFDTHAWQLAWAMASFLERGGHWHDAATSQRRALAAATRLGDPNAQATSHVCLATYAYVPLGRYADAEDHLIQALALYQRLGDRTGQARAHRSLALLFDRQDRYAEALDHSQQALDLFQAAGHRFGQAREMNAVGWYHIQLGKPELGLSYCQQSLDLQREIDDQDGQADTLDSIATAHTALSNQQEAIAHYQQAVILYREFGHRHREADTLACLGDVLLAYGRPGEARQAWEAALAIFDELGRTDGSELREKLKQLPSGTTIASLA